MQHLSSCSSIFPLMPYRNHPYRRYKGRACEKCGSITGLGIHHKDGDHKNNNPRNLETLCGHCHMKHHMSLVNKEDWLDHFGPKGRDFFLKKKQGMPCLVCGVPAGPGKKGYCTKHYWQLRRAQKQTRPLMA